MVEVAAALLIVQRAADARPVLPEGKRAVSHAPRVLPRPADRLLGERPKQLSLIRRPEPSTAAAGSGGPRPESSSRRAVAPRAASVFPAIRFSRKVPSRLIGHTVEARQYPSTSRSSTAGRARPDARRAGRRRVRAPVAPGGHDRRAPRLEAPFGSDKGDFC